MHKQRTDQADYDALAKLKKINRERAEDGKTAIFAKKREVKEMKLKDKFDLLDSNGRLDKYMQKMAEPKRKKGGR